MIVTSPDSLWSTRLKVISTLGPNRRPTQLPEHSSPRVNNKLCDNLYIDSNHLRIWPSDDNSLYIAHEILQAKCLFDRSNIHARFLVENSWTKKYLPTAYREATKNLSMINYNLTSNITSKVVNLIMFIVQYLYMRSKMTSERVGLGYAFFHPTRKD